MPTSRTRLLLSALFRDLPDRRHILTVHTGRVESTSLVRHRRGWDIGHPPTVERLSAALAGGRSASVVLRSFTQRVSHTLPDGTEVPVKVVRGWQAADHALIPLDEAQMFDAHCTDAASGEPVPPEPGVEFAPAPPVDLSAFHAR